MHQKTIPMHAHTPVTIHSTGRCPGWRNIGSRNVNAAIPPEPIKAYVSVAAPPGVS